MTWKPTQDRSAVSGGTKLYKCDNRACSQEVTSFPSDELLAQVDDSELSKFTSYVLQCK